MVSTACARFPSSLQPRPAAPATTGLFWLLALFALLASLLAPPLQAETTASLQRTRGYVNDVVLLDIVTDDLSAERPELNLPDGLQVLGQTHSSRREIINGKVSASQSWRFRLLLAQSGHYKLPKIRVGKDETAELSLLVLEPAEKNTAATSDDEIIFEHELKPESVVVGQQLQLTLRVLRRVPMRYARLGQPNPGDSAALLHVEDDVEYETERAGHRYQVTERNYFLFPQQPGALSIPPLLFEADVQRNASSSLFSPFDQVEPVRLTVHPKPVEVRAAPGAVPATGYRLDARIEPVPDSFRVGEPFTWVISIEADGQRASALPAIEAPEHPAFRFYPDKPVDEQLVTAEGVRSKRVQRFAVIPRLAGGQQLPNLGLENWWDSSRQVAERSPQPVSLIDILPAASGGANKPAATAKTAGRSDDNSAGDTPDTADHDAEPAPAEDAGVGALLGGPARLWMNLSAVFALAWLLTLGLWWNSRRRAARTASLSGAAAADLAADLADARAEPASARASWQQLQNACAGNDAETAGRALLDWAARISGQRQTLASLAAACSGELRQTLLALDQLLYGPPPRQWSGSALAAQLDRLRQQLSGAARSSARKQAQTETAAGSTMPAAPRRPDAAALFD